MERDNSPPFLADLLKPAICYILASARIAPGGSRIDRDPRDGDPVLLRPDHHRTALERMIAIRRVTEVTEAGAADESP